MKHPQTKPPLPGNADATSYYYLSNQGEVIYAPAGSTRQDTDRRKFTDSLDDTRLPRPSTPSGSSDRSSSVPSSTSSASVSSASTIDVSSDTIRTPEPSPFLHGTPRLGLPKDWVIYPFSKGRHKHQILHDTASAYSKHGWHHEQYTSHDDSGSEYDMDPKRIDYTRPLTFELSTESATTPVPPSYHSRRSSSIDSYPSLPPYPGTPEFFPGSESGKIFCVPPLHLIPEAEDEERHALYHKDHNLPVIRVTDQGDLSPQATSPAFKHKPKLQHSRPLPQEFNETDLHEIRRQTRHCIRVVTRSSIGLVSTTALASVAPQLLIAAAINAYCLGRGARKLHEHLIFLRDNELKIRKRDVLVAVAEGVAVKVAFMAITINHDDFVVLAHQALGAHAHPLIEVLHEHPIPGISMINEHFIKPMEHLEEMLGLPTMLQQAEGARHNIDALYGPGGWNSGNAALIVENVFLVGGVQAGMEHGLDMLQDQAGRAAKFIKERLEWKARRRRLAKEEEAYKKIMAEPDWDTSKKGKEKWMMRKDRALWLRSRNSGETEVVTSDEKERGRAQSSGKVDVTKLFRMTKGPSTLDHKDIIHIDDKPFVGSDNKGRRSSV